jgi:hypothetical protein
VEGCQQKVTWKKNFRRTILPPFLGRPIWQVQTAWRYGPSQPIQRAQAARRPHTGPPVALPTDTHKCRKLPKILHPITYVCAYCAYCALFSGLAYCRLNFNVDSIGV